MSRTGLALDRDLPHLVLEVPDLVGSRTTLTARQPLA